MIRVISPHLLWKSMKVTWFFNLWKSAQLCWILQAHGTNMHYLGFYSEGLVKKQPYAREYSSVDGICQSVSGLSRVEGSRALLTIAWYTQINNEVHFGKSTNTVLKDLCYSLTVTSLILLQSMLTKILNIYNFGFVTCS